MPNRTNATATMVMDTGSMVSRIFPKHRQQYTRTSGIQAPRQDPHPDAVLPTHIMPIGILDSGGVVIIATAILANDRHWLKTGISDKIALH